VRLHCLVTVRKWKFVSEFFFFFFLFFFYWGVVGYLEMFLKKNSFDFFFLFCFLVKIFLLKKKMYPLESN
jgi:hypothetical protein